MSENITNVTDGSFDQEVLNADGPVLVDYWAEWCGPCKMIAPIVEEIAEEYGDKLKVAKMDIDSNMQTPQQYSIRGIRRRSGLIHPGAATGDLFPARGNHWTLPHNRASFSSSVAGPPARLEDFPDSIAGPRPPLPGRRDRKGLTITRQ